MKKTPLFEQIKSAVKFTTGFFALLGMFVTAWVQLGFPIPASAEDVKRLSKGQANIGIKVQLQAEAQIRRDLFELRWKLREVQAEAKTQKNKDFQKYIEQRIVELEALEQAERDQRTHYKEQLQRATK